MDHCPATGLACSPTPWRQHCPEDQQTADWIIDDDGRLVASIHPSGRSWKANARLIAAAPALEEALEALLDVFLDGRMVDLDDRERRAYAKATAALDRVAGTTGNDA
jgi:hypothetical protein